jgi:GMP synthase-like glutamine amidotransferase
VRVHWLQHSEAVTLGCIEPWLADRGLHPRCTRLFADETLPRIDQFDWLIVMGGLMSAYDEAPHPWLQAEKALIGAAIDGSKKVLGVCLGAQLIAEVVGGAVQKLPHAEVGWHRVKRTAAPSHFFDGVPEAFDAFQYHGDGFSLPAGVRSLMRSTACANQAFEIGRRVAAVQFHPEVEGADIERWLSRHPAVPGRFVQPPEAILPATPDACLRNNAVMFSLLQKFL